ncbi:hypothetical protein DC3_14790 [Deinococcus cellulosilyticus NBRC 106333 = KACC 11606]|uniref:Kinase n=1 Tax=Deinococcus cellulosilyticus (strain DSM 18568 / NBRC 106333 / KACC 11606 / 5516J-15) TaxID=1223518 RepID=A0A511MZ27_DEIC1|nr:hypothetical protein DC3_14790 [Deinococcus cellulosilyticus NBRC 106333 = KACC 11606]
MLIGLQASGKTSFYQQRFAATHLHLSKDLWKHNRQFKQQKQLREALEKGQSVVIDNTNPTVQDRAGILQQARNAGASTTGYYFQSKLETCLERNRKRERVVPEVGVRATSSKLQLPSLQEGFDRLFYVQLQAGTFIVSPWEKP